LLLREVIQLSQCRKEGLEGVEPSHGTQPFR
jgi:hypothetical protein